MSDPKSGRNAFDLLGKYRVDFLKVKKATGKSYASPPPTKCVLQLV